MSELRAFDYAHGDVTLHGQVALPEGDAPHPMVMVMHNALGIGRQIRERALELAGMGYVAVITDMYGALPDEAARRAMHHVLKDDPKLLRERVLATYAAARTVEGTDTARIAAIGYCFGGRCVLEMARGGLDLACVVSFHGILETAMPAQSGAVKAKVLAITGAQDPYAPPAHVEAFQREMTGAGVDWRLTTYSQAMHAFTDPESGTRADIPGVRYDPQLAHLSWIEATAFLEATLQA